MAGSAGISGQDAELLARAAQWPHDPNLSDLTVERLAAVASETTLEFATALFYDRARRRAKKVGLPSAEDASMLSKQNMHLSADIIGIVPGAFHGQHKHTGADGLKIVETVEGLAPKTEIIPVRSFGPLEENAETILQWLEARRGARILLTSLSKGGADLKCALSSSRAAVAFANVVAWVSFSGIVQGTPLIAWLRARPLRSTAFRLLLRLQGHRAAVLDQLHRHDASPLASWPSLPPHLTIVHVCGCPLRHHLRHHWAPRGYDRVAPLGPNDGGGILLGDLARLPGVVFPIWGTDHYLQPSWEITPLLRSVVLAASRGELRHAIQPATPPTKAPASKSSE
jgi:hypothetical protein